MNQLGLALHDSLMSAFVVGFGNGLCLLQREDFLLLVVVVIVLLLLRE